jgi:hypothetical protein
MMKATPKITINFQWAAVRGASTGGTNPDHDQRHSPQHAAIHRHARQDEAHIPPHPEHWQMQQDADTDDCRAQPEGEHIAPLEG